MNNLLFCLIFAAAGPPTRLVESAAIQPLYEDANQIRELLKVLQQSIETSETLLNIIDDRANEIEESLEGTVDCHTKEEEEEETDEILEVVISGEQPKWLTEKPTDSVITTNIHDKEVVFGSEGSVTHDALLTMDMLVTTPLLGDLGDRETLPPAPGPSSGPGQATQHCFIKGVNDFSEMYNHAGMDYSCLMKVYDLFGDSRGSLQPYHRIRNARPCDSYSNFWKKIPFTTAGCERLRLKCKKGKGNSNKNCCLSMKCYKDVRRRKAEEMAFRRRN